MSNVTYWKLSGVLFLAGFVINLKPLIAIGLMCSGDSGHCGV